MSKKKKKLTVKEGVTFITKSGYIIDPVNNTISAPSGEDINYTLLNREIKKLRRVNEDARKLDMDIVKRPYINSKLILANDWREIHE